MYIRIYVYICTFLQIYIYMYIYIFIHTDLNSLPFLLTLSKPHSPRTDAVAPHELRCDSPAHSENKAALSLHGVHSPLVPPLSHTPRSASHQPKGLTEKKIHRGVSASHQPAPTRPLSLRRKAVSKLRECGGG